MIYRKKGSHLPDPIPEYLMNLLSGIPLTEQGRARIIYLWQTNSYTKSATESQKNMSEENSNSIAPCPSSAIVAKESNPESGTRPTPKK